MRQKRRVFSYFLAFFEKKMTFSKKHVKKKRSQNALFQKPGFSCFGVEKSGAEILLKNPKTAFLTKKHHF
jgi:hypothetical protein